MTAQRHEPCPHWPKAQFALWWTASYFCTPLHSVSGSALFFLLIKGQEQGCWEWTEWGSFCALLERRTVEHFSWASTELCNSHPVQTLRGCLLPGRGCCCQSVFNEVELTSWASGRNADHKDQRLCVPVVCLICLGVNCPARRVFLLIFEFFWIFVKYFLKPDPIIFLCKYHVPLTHALIHSHITDRKFQLAYTLHVFVPREETRVRGGNPTITGRTLKHATQKMLTTVPPRCPNII